MRALTISQPWAGLIVGSFSKSHGLLRSTEVRKWTTKYRGPLLIHAGSKIDKNAAEHFEMEMQKENTGVILGFVILKDVVRIKNEKEWSALRKRHLEYGERCYGDNTYLWVLENPIVFRKQICCDGKLGLWIPAPHVLKNIDKEHASGIAYKVLRKDLSSLGLFGASRMRYVPSTWNKPSEPVSAGSHGGGLWVAPTVSAARAQQRYMLKKHGTKTRVFRCVIGNRLRETSCRVKTDKLFFDLSDEIF
ncbi:MAG: hypothetical protein HYT27_03520 [Parcubacteria group bacterium]|nr:hypothetical protein [Parcubacteria group bacterium]